MRALGQTALLRRGAYDCASLRVALFVTCLNEALFPRTAIATTQLLERLGQKVVFPEGQTCCGQMHFNGGYEVEALALARRFARVFADAGAVVAPSGSCVAMVRDNYPRLAAASGDEALVRDIAALVPRVFELSQFLVGELGVEELGARFDGRVTYHPTCHSLRLLRVGDAPLKLLRRVEGLELTELPGAEECCGFGGTFAVKNSATSGAMVDEKVEAIAATGAAVVTALDNSCLMNIGGRLLRRRLPVRAVHLAEILAP